MFFFFFSCCDFRICYRGICSVVLVINPASAVVRWNALLPHRMCGSSVENCGSQRNLNLIGSGFFLRGVQGRFSCRVLPHDDGMVGGRHRHIAGSNWRDLSFLFSFCQRILAFIPSFSLSVQYRDKPFNPVHFVAQIIISPLTRSVVLALTDMLN